MKRRMFAWMLLILAPANLWAATESQLAIAAIGIAQARIELGKLQPQLPDKPPQVQAPTIDSNDPPIPEGFPDDKGRLDAPRENGSPDAGHRDVAHEQPEALTKALEAIAVLQQEQQRLGEELNDCLKSVPKSSAPVDGTPPPSVYEGKSLPKITVMVCDGETCTEHSGTLTHKADGLCQIQIETDRFAKSPKASVTAVTIDGSAYEAKYVAAKDNAVTMIVDMDSPPAKEKTPVLGTPQKVGEYSVTAPIDHQPMKLVGSSPMESGSAGPIHLTVYTATGIQEHTWCAPCNRFHKDNGAGDERVSIEYVQTDHPPQVKDRHGRLFTPALPCTVWEGGDGTKMYLEGYHSRDELYRIITKPNNNPPRPSNIASAGPAGTIHAGSQVRQMFAYFGQYIGEGKVSSFDWQRPQSKINLLALKDVEAVEWMGKSGRIQLDSPDAIGLPVKSLAFTYRLVGKNLVIDAEPFTLQGIVDQLGLSKSASATGETPVGIIGIDDALLVWQIISCIRDIVALLHPTADIMIPDEVAGNAVLNGDILTIKFDKPVTIRIQWVFTFPLAVKTVTIDQSKMNVHCEFSGSKWIRSRDFSIGDNLQSSVAPSPEISIVREIYVPPIEMNPIQHSKQIGFGNPWYEEDRFGRVHDVSELHLSVDHHVPKSVLDKYRGNPDAWNRLHGWCHENGL